MQVPTVARLARPFWASDLSRGRQPTPAASHHGHETLHDVLQRLSGNFARSFRISRPGRSRVWRFARGVSLLTLISDEPLGTIRVIRGPGFK